eukprot:10423481-Prorocentrum_lima.AAC.1
MNGSPKNTSNKAEQAVLQAVPACHASLEGINVFRLYPGGEWECQVHPLQTYNRVGKTLRLVCSIISSCRAG